jgi:hypothetical protein
MEIKFAKVGDMVRLPNGSAGSEVRVTRTEFKGKEYIDIRKYYLPDEVEIQEGAPASADLFKPTTKGIMLTPERFQELMDEALRPIHDGMEAGEIVFGKSGRG